MLHFLVEFHVFDAKSLGQSQAWTAYLITDYTIPPLSNNTDFIDAREKIAAINWAHGCWSNMLWWWSAISDVTRRDSAIVFRLLVLATHTAALRSDRVMFTFFSPTEKTLVLLRFHLETFNRLSIDGKAFSYSSLFLLLSERNEFLCTLINCTNGLWRKSNERFLNFSFFRSKPIEGGECKISLLSFVYDFSKTLPTISAIISMLSCEPQWNLQLESFNTAKELFNSINFTI